MSKQSEADKMCDESANAERLRRQPTPEEEDYCALQIKRVLTGGLVLFIIIAFAVGVACIARAEPLTLRTYESMATN